MKEAWVNPMPCSKLFSGLGWKLITQALGHQSVTVSSGYGLSAGADLDATSGRPRQVTILFLGNFRRTIDLTYKATRQTLAERRAADRRRQLERLDPPLAWVLSGPAWPCCPELAPER